LLADSPGRLRTVAVGMAITIPIMRPISMTIMRPVLAARRRISVARSRAGVVGKRNLLARRLKFVPRDRIPRLGDRALMAGRDIFRKGSHGLVVNNPLQVQPQLLHLRETFGRNVVTALALLLFFLHPSQFFGRFDKYAPQRKGIHRANAVFFRVFGFHMTPLPGCGDGMLSMFYNLRKFRGQTCAYGEKRPAGRFFGRAPVLELEFVLYPSPACEARRFL